MRLNYTKPLFTTKYSKMQTKMMTIAVEPVRCKLNLL